MSRTTNYLRWPVILFGIVAFSALAMTAPKVSVGVRPVILDSTTRASSANRSVFRDDFSTNPTTSGEWRIYRAEDDTENEAAWDPTGQVYLTRAVGWKASAMFANYALSARQWTAHFRFRAGPGGGDGFIFFFYKDESPYTENKPGKGGFLGFQPWADVDGIPGYGIEFDSWNNGGEFSIGDVSEHHIALIDDSVANHVVTVNDLRTEDDTWHDASVHFDRGRVTVEIDGQVVLSHRIVNPDYRFNGLGFSAGTATAVNNHIIDDFELFLGTASSTVPLYLQTANPWQGDTYGRYPPGDSVNTIRRWGCFMSSAAMIISSYGQARTPSFTTDPGIFNAWLRDNNGYTPGNTVIWDKIVAYARLNKVPLSINGSTKGRNDARLDQALNVGDLAILGVNGGGHYVVATQKVMEAGVETYAINDPIYGRTTLRSQYRNIYSSMLILGITASDSRSLTISAHSPVEIVVTDPLGRRVGFDPRTGETFEEIPDATYVLSPLTADGDGPTPETITEKIVAIHTPIAGNYQVHVVGTDRGHYDIVVSSVDTNGWVASNVTGGETDRGAEAVLEFTFRDRGGIAAPVLYLPSVVR